MKKPGPPHGAPPSQSRPLASPETPPHQPKSPQHEPKIKGSKTPRPLSDGENMLWRHTASSLQPLKRAKGRVHAALEDQDTTPAAKPGSTSKTSAATPNLPGKSPAASAAPHRPVPLAANRPSSTPPPAATKPPPLADFDSKRARKLRTGQVEIDARIDLHGLRQAEAHVALRGFLHSCLRKGHRVVLVITGKGAPGTRPDGPRTDHWGDAMGRSERGILRRNVPQWLSEPDLRAIVVSYTTAAIRHGGDGALYVHLRRPR